MTVRERFIIETFLLSRVNPERWDRFMAVLGNYTTNVVESAVMVGDTYAVGMGRQALMFFKELQELDKSYEKIKEKKA